MPYILPTVLGSPVPVVFSEYISGGTDFVWLCVGLFVCLFKNRAVIPSVVVRDSHLLNVKFPKQ